MAVGHPDTEIGKVIFSRGVAVPPGDTAAFANAIIRLSENPKEFEKLGNAVREFAIQALDRNKILSQFGEVLNSYR